MDSAFPVPFEVSVDHLVAKHMRIVLYTVNFAPEPTGIGKYSGEMAAWLVEHGHTVRVVAAPPYYPAWKLDPNYSWPPYRRETWQGSEVFRCPLWVPKEPGGVARVAHLLSFAISSFPVMMRQVLWRPDLVITVAPAFLCAPMGLFTARLAGAQAWLHLQDFEVDLAFRMGLLSGRLLQRIVLRMERWLLRRFDSVSSISSRMVETLLTKGVELKKTRFFPNWVDIAHIKPNAANCGAYRQELGISKDAKIVMFSGSLGGKQGLMAIPGAATLLAHRSDIVFVICGDGVMKPALQDAMAGLPNTRFIPLQPVERLGELLCTADIHLLPQSPDAADLVLPSKLSGMLASGRPVISTCQPGTELDSVVSSCGLVVPADDAPAFAEAISKLADETALRLELGRRARAYAETNFERDAILSRIFGPIEGENESGVTRDVTA